MKLNQIITAIAVTTGLSFGSAFAADTMTPAQKTQIESIVHDYIIQNPDVIVQAVQSMQQKQMDQMRSKGEAAALKNFSGLFSNPSDPMAGNAQGKISIVEFFDYQCPHCVDMDPVFVALIKANPNIRVVYKEFPIRGPISVFASKAALAANLQGKYIPFHEALMNGAKDLTEAKIMDIAATVGLDVKKLKTDMNGPVIAQQVKDTYKLAQDIGIYGTPAIFVAETTLPANASASAINFIPGQVDQKYLQDAIDKVGKA
jgi:protein-disulfide isomerase